MDILVSIFLLIIAYFIGTQLIEKRHYRQIIKREKEFLHLPAVNFKSIDPEVKVKEVRLVTGSVCVSIDYFKRFLANLRNLVGGEISSYESIIDRGRREAILRMKEEARGADMIINTRIETSVLGFVTDKKSIGCCEILAYGTALFFEKSF